MNKDFTNPNSCTTNCHTNRPCDDVPTNIVCSTNNPKNTCVPCHETCLLCNHALFTGCASCLADVTDSITPEYYLLVSQCLETCPSHSYANDDDP